MKPFLLTAVKFSLPLIFALAVIFMMPVSRQYAYSFVTRGGCEGRSSWIFQRIFKDTTVIDVAFIGSSHTMSAVNDAMIEEQFDGVTQLHWHFCNLAYCGFGRNINYIVAKDLLHKKRVKLLVLEIRESEGTLGHGNFAQVASPMDVLNAPMAFNRS
jgi:hypothetical protein